MLRGKKIFFFIWHASSIKVTLSQISDPASQAVIEIYIITCGVGRDIINKPNLKDATLQEQEVSTLGSGSIAAVTSPLGHCPSRTFNQPAWIGQQPTGQVSLQSALDVYSMYWIIAARILRTLIKRNIYFCVHLIRKESLKKNSY